ncbi:MAG TPA: hypothetical protein DDW84_04705 [Phycisphaerales bacterium]|nr:hypothetical protein [Phycisphaerales bacterium]HBR19067.1 hypothetical protein [Phycisphaerales bacterium]
MQMKLAATIKLSMIPIQNNVAVKEPGIPATKSVSPVVTAIVATFQIAKFAKAALVSGLFRQICTKPMLKIWATVYFILNTRGNLRQEIWLILGIVV